MGMSPFFWHQYESEPLSTLRFAQFAADGVKLGTKY